MTIVWEPSKRLTGGPVGPHTVSMTTIQIPTFNLQDRMVKARRVHGLSQAEMAHELGIGFKTLQRYEQGLSIPPRAVLIGLAVTCGVDVSWLLTGHAGDDPTESFTRDQRTLFDWAAVA